MDYPSLGNRIRVSRKQRRMTQAELALEIGISLSFMGHVERGTRKASLETLLKAAAALGTTPNALLQDSIPPAAPCPLPEELGQIIAVIQGALDQLTRVHADACSRR